jgi:lipoyl synthase
MKKTPSLRRTGFLSFLQQSRLGPKAGNNPENCLPGIFGHVAVSGIMSTKTKIDSALHIDRKPPWIKVRLPSNPTFWSTKGLISDLKLHTVCEEAQCPNRWECWSQGTATFMIAGDRCTRACGFCAVKTAKPFALEADEPQRVAKATKRMGLNHVVITAVARDDLADGGALHFAQTIEAVRTENPGITIEILVPDFNGKDDALQTVMDAKPHIFNHNLETVERLTPLVRSRAMYRRSLQVLKRAKEMGGERIATKSGIMLGLGETEEEILVALDDLRAADVTVLTLGQYLRPSEKHLPVVEYITPEKFDFYKQVAEQKGFRHVASAPLVRSSYHAADFKPELDLIRDEKSALASV